MVEYWQRKPKIIPEFGVVCSSFAALCGTFGRRGTTDCWEIGRASCRERVCAIV